MRCLVFILSLMLILPLAPKLSAEPVDDPILRSFYWFRFVGGKDVREFCAANQGDYYRLVYNAISREQMRAYDIKAPRGSAAELTVRIISPATVNVLNLSEFNDILGPWRGAKQVRSLAAGELGQLVSQLEQSGAFGPLQVGMEVPSNDFYWAVSSCHRGSFHFQVYHHPTDRFARVRFDKTLFSLDRTGVPVNEPRDLAPSRFRGDQTYVWRLKVGRDGPIY